MKKPWLQACINGKDLPETDDNALSFLLKEASLAVSAGATDLHVHPKNTSGVDSMTPATVTESLIV